MVVGLSYFALGVQNVVFLILGPLGVDFDLSSGPPHPHTHFFTTVKHTFLIKHHFEFNLALEGALGSPLGSIWGGLGWLLVARLVSLRVRGGTPNFQNFLFWHP